MRIEVIEQRAIKYIQSAHLVASSLAASPFSKYLHKRFQSSLRHLGAIFESGKLLLEALWDKILVSSGKASKVLANMVLSLARL